MMLTFIFFVTVLSCDSLPYTSVKKKTILFLCLIYPLKFRNNKSYLSVFTYIPVKYLVFTTLRHVPSVHLI